MDATTLFKTYGKALKKAHELDLQIERLGDRSRPKQRYYMRKMLRYERLADKIERRIEGKPFCPVCGLSPDSIIPHYSSCSRYERQEAR